MECVECRNTGVTKRGVCPKCPAGQRFLARSDGGLRMALDPEFAKRMTAEPTRGMRVPLEQFVPLAARVCMEMDQLRSELGPEARAELERLRRYFGFEKGDDADREAAPVAAPGSPPELSAAPSSPAPAAPSSAPAELELLRENVELRRRLDEQQRQLEQLLLRGKSEPE